MEKQISAGRGKLLPDIALPSAEGRQVRLSDYRGRSNLVVILAGGLDDGNLLRLLDEAAWKHSDFAGEEAEMIVILSKDRAGQTPPVVKAGWPFVILADSERRAHRLFNALDAAGKPLPAIFIADRYGEICAEYQAGAQHGIPKIDEVLQWLFFINSQCPECGAPEWP